MDKDDLIFYIKIGLAWTVFVSGAVMIAAIVVEK
jgi:hypothetical protein